MKILTLAGVSLAVALSGAAPSPSRAADLAPSNSPAPVTAERPFDWGGFFVGGFAGGSLGSSSQGYSVSSTYLSANLPSLIPFVNAAGSQGLNLRGGDFGFEVGYNANVAPKIVVGVAADFAGTTLEGARATSGALPIVQLPYTISQQLRAEWLGSLRLRAGVTPLNNLLIYATGGPAFGQFKYSASFVDVLLPPFAPGAETENATFQAVRVGWTLGAGAEWAMNRNWSLSGEFQHSEYAALSGTGSLQLQQPTSTAYVGHSSGAIQVNALRIGVGYHFN